MGYSRHATEYSVAYHKTRKMLQRKNCTIKNFFLYSYNTDRKNELHYIIAGVAAKFVTFRERELCYPIVKELPAHTANFRPENLVDKYF